MRQRGRRPAHAGGSWIGGLARACSPRRAWPPPPPPSAQSDIVYQVSNYPVSATAADAVTAKEKALEEGQRDAFRYLLKRLVDVTAYRSCRSFRRRASRTC